MSDTRDYVQTLLDSKKLKVATNRLSLFDSFVADEQTIYAVKQILQYQDMLTDKWKLQSRIADIQQQQVVVPNGTEGKPYDAALDFDKLGWTDLSVCELDGLDETGLVYDTVTKKISGIPSKNGDIKLKINFKVNGQPEDAALNEKVLTLIINPDPKSLWKNLPSDKEDPYWKEDNAAVFSSLGEKHLVVASKRGRSHANVGSFRDDDFAFKTFADTGWSVITVADGAGSARISRKGSSIACSAVVDYFTDNITGQAFTDFDVLVREHKAQPTDESQKKMSHFVYNNLGQAALSVHKKLDAFAQEIKTPLKDLHTTLIFVLLKKYDFGYAVLSFGVGDCPIGLLNKDLSEISLMNWLDVGEFGGGTRFITMPEIFQSDKFATRFGYKLIDDFAYLMLMTDGIYDPKFVVEANLEKVGNWKSFIEDLKGANPEGTKVTLEADNKQIAEQLSTWMDFWSAGNHDDRTLAIIF